MHGRVACGDEAEDLVAGREAADTIADLLDDAGVVAAERDGKLVLDHVLEHPGGDRVVDRVGRGGADAHEHLAGAGVGAGTSSRSAGGEPSSFQVKAFIGSRRGRGGRGASWGEAPSGCGLEAR